MPRKEKVTSEENIRTASACIEGKISVLGVADRLGVHASVVDDWIRLYQTEGIEAFLPRDRNRRYDPVLKEAAVRDYLLGKGSIRAICRKYKIRDTKQLRTWIKVYNGHKDFKKQTGGSRMTKGKRNYPS